MALINCPECGRKISDAADGCPHCGRKSDACNLSSGLTSIGIALMLLGLIIMMMGGC